jgi:hypothetical protein
MASNRTILVNQLLSLAGSERAYAANNASGVTANNAAAYEAQLAVGTTRFTYPISAINTAVDNVIVGSLAATDFTGNAVIASASLVTPLSQNTGANGLVLTIWKRDAAGTRTNVGEINTANLAANVNTYGSSSLTSLNVSNAEVVQGGSFGYQLAVLGTGVGVTTGVLTLTLRPR